MNDSEPVTAAQHLAAFEARHLTVAHADATTHTAVHGGIEKGRGSHFSRLSEQHKAHHAALEELVKAEAAHNAAHQAMDVAEANVMTTSDALHAALAKVAATDPGDEPIDESGEEAA
jgi:hypothetical protein